MMLWLSKFGRWRWRDLYCLPIALVLWPVVAFDYWKRGVRLTSRIVMYPVYPLDTWHPADWWLVMHGYAVTRLPPWPS